MAREAPRKPPAEPGAEPRAWRSQPGLLAEGVVSVSQTGARLLLHVSTPSPVGRQGCGGSAVGQGPSWRLPSIPPARAEASEDRYLPEGCSPLKEQLLRVGSSHRVPHVLKESMGTSSVPRLVKAAAAHRQFAQCDQNFQPRRSGERAAPLLSCPCSASLPCP